MGRFSKHDAEAAGWIIVHQRGGYDISTSDVQGESRTIPASYRAEKYVNDVLINEEGETMGLLLERIALKEAQLQAANVKQVPAVIPEDIPRDAAGIEQRTVIVSEDPEDLSADAPVRKISEEELTSLTRNDALLVKDEDGEHVMQNVRPTDAALAADDAQEAQSTAVENRRTQEPDVGDAVQITPDDSQTVVDTPGGATGSVLVVREGEEDPEDLAARRDIENEAEESARVARQTEVGFHAAPEGEDKLAGVGVSIRDRAALGSEVPRQGETHEAGLAVTDSEAVERRADGLEEAGLDEDAEWLRDQAEAARTLQEETAAPPETEGQTEEPAEARQEAQEDAAKQLTEDEGKQADSDEHAGEVESAGTDAEQKIADEQASDSEHDSSEEDKESQGQEAPEAPAESSEPAEHVEIEPGETAEVEAKQPQEGANDDGNAGDASGQSD